MIFLYFFCLFWLLRQIKSFLFWIFLWQLKEYHVGRFVDHFRTEKGKRMFKNFLFLSKIFLLPFLFFFPSLLLFLFFIYFLESSKFLFDIFRKKILLPVFTKKTIFLSLFSFFFTLSFLFCTFPNLIWLLIFDLLSSAIFSGIVLVFQPVSTVWRWQKIKKAIKKREKFKDLIVIGITGSFGKTSTKEFLFTILKEKFKDKVLATKAHQNSEIAISNLILNELKGHHKILICEMGAYNKGGIKLLCKMAKPKIGIITGVNEQHLALFGSMENLISAEGGKELISNLPKDGLVIFNGENEILTKIYKKTKIKKKIVGIEKEDFDLRAQNIKLEKERIIFDVISKDGDFANFELNLIGAQNIQNVLLAACCAREFSMNLAEISKSCQKITQEQSGVKLIKTKKGFNVIEATYSANPDSVLSHLEYLKVWKGKRAIVMPCLIELGSASKRIHQEIGKKIFEICDLAIITTKDHFKQIKKGAKEKAIFCQSPFKIFSFLKNFHSKEDIILLEGRISPAILNSLQKLL